MVAVLSWVAPTEASALGFTGDFAPVYWQAQPGLGTIFFANGDTELHIVGPTDLPSPQSSIDSILYAGPGGLGVPTVGTLTFSFTWSFNSGDALNAQSDFAWLNPPGPSSIHTFASGPAGTILTGMFAVPLDAGATFSFLLTTDNPNGKKTAAELIIDNAEFQSSVPDASSSLVLLVFSVTLLALCHRCVSRRV